MIRQIPIPELTRFLAEPENAALLRTGVGSMGHRITVADVVHLLHSGHMQLWASEGALVLSEVVEYPRMKVLRLFGLAGENLPHLATLLPTIRAWGAEMGCSECEATDTHAGLQKAIPEFKQTGVCLVMPIAQAEEKAA
jgi:hypothetical protein